ncbi:cystatin-like [Hyla sarda]|uniref:cystatin-like n=1 Tax=Hyla sarda TaxID=327740 RepID=UPI0024C2EC9A|nr:cystatin-like [Hyla sarda]
MAQLWITVAVLVCWAAVTQAGRLLGGREPVDVSSSGVKQALSFAMYEYNRGSNDMYASRPVTVRKAERQVVSGYKYFLDVDVGRTQCRKPTTDMDVCDLHTDPAYAKVSTCHFVVYYVPWTSQQQLQKSECD